jgi:hypothetical protein
MRTLLPPPPPQVLTDETRVRQIIMNGLTNAVKYSNAPENGAIRVVLRVCDDVAAGPASASAPHAATRAALVVAAADPAAARAHMVHWLCFAVVDHGPGLRGVGEDKLFTDFLAPITTHDTHACTPVAGSIHVGSSGVGLPVCARCALPRRDATAMPFI